MKDEIKEIERLNNIIDLKELVNYMREKDFEIEHWRYKHLKEFKSRKRCEEKNEKAIEYGNNCLENIEEYDEYVCESIDIVGLLRMIHKNYLNILKGDKDERKDN